MVDCCLRGVVMFGGSEVTMLCRKLNIRFACSGQVGEITKESKEGNVDIYVIVTQKSKCVTMAMMTRRG